MPENASSAMLPAIMQRARQFHLSTWVLFLLLGCSTTVPISSFSERSASGTGVAYTLPRGLIKVTAGPSAPYVASEVLLAPDPNARYFAQVATSVTSSDTFALEVGANGLLDLASSDSTDVTPLIVSELSRGVSGILSGAARGAPSFAAGADQTIVPTTIILDPYINPNESSSGVSVSVTDVWGRRLQNALGPRPRCPDGVSVCFPMLQPVIVRVTVGAINQEFFHIIPDTTSVGYLNLERAPCVKSVSEIDLQDGILVKHSLERGSVVAGCLSIPLDVVSAILRAPIDAITGRSSRLQSEKAALQAQKDLLNAQVELLQAQAAVADAEAESATRSLSRDGDDRLRQ